MRQNPCKDCTKRKMRCHSTCEDYINWKADYLAQKKVRQDFLILQCNLDKRRNEAIAKMIKK